MNNNEIRFRITWKMWAPVLLFLAPLILEHQLAGTFFSPYIYGFLVIIVGIIYYFRFRLWHPLAVMLGTAIAIWTYFLAARPEETYESFKLAGIDLGPSFVPFLHQHWNEVAWLGVLFINAVVFYLCMPRYARALDYERSAIRLFRLAARELSEAQNGFTGRPYQAGEHPFERNEVIGLASFLEQKRICVADFTGSGIKLIFSMGISPLNKRLRNGLSYVTFGDDGSLSVFISQHDYSQYRKEYTFDQLCEKMGKTFIRFAEHSKNNNPNLIITELRST